MDQEGIDQAELEAMARFAEAAERDRRLLAATRQGLEADALEPVAETPGSLAIAAFLRGEVEVKALDRGYFSSDGGHVFYLQIRGADRDAAREIAGRLGRILEADELEDGTATFAIVIDGRTVSAGKLCPLCGGDHGAEEACR